MNDGVKFEMQSKVENFKEGLKGRRTDELKLMIPLLGYDIPMLKENGCHLTIRMFQQMCDVVKGEIEQRECKLV
jgi:hypothetical protein